MALYCCGTGGPQFMIAGHFQTLELGLPEAAVWGPARPEADLRFHTRPSCGAAVVGALSEGAA
jgi:hypothetical protein